MKEITRYLQEVASQECQLYTQQKLLSNISKRASRLGIVRNIPKPDKWKRYQFELNFQSTLWLSLLVSLVSFVYCFIKLLSSGTNQREGLKYSTAMFVSPIKCFLISFAVIVVIRNIYNLIIHNTKNKKIYNSKIDAYNTAIRNDQLRVERELLQRKMLISQSHAVSKEIKRTRSTLDSLYSLNIIHPKYRNLVAISYLYDYFDTGRCVSLTGPGGAYATYEEDLHFQRIETRLDVIINKLDEIIENQQYIGDLMREANTTLHRIEEKNNQIAKSMNCVVENSELTAYNTRCAAKSAAVMEHIAIYHALIDY